jgi:S1-C subfamily serine protease
VILRFGDREIEGVAGLRDALAERKPGQTVKLRIRRGPGDETAGSPLTLSVTLGRKL